MDKHSAAEEHRLFERWATTGDIAARNSVIEANLWLLGVVARHFRCLPIDRSELMAEGSLALLVAFERFDPARNVRFATYARHWVYAAMSAFLARSRNALGSVSRARRARQRSFRDVSLDAPVPGDEAVTLLDRLAAESPCVDSAIDAGRRNRLLAEAVEDVRKSLGARGRVVLDERFIRDEPERLESVAARMGLSPERTRQIEGRVRTELASRLRGPLGGDARRVCPRDTSRLG